MRSTLDYRGQLLIAIAICAVGLPCQTDNYRDLRTPEIQVRAKALRPRNRKKTRRLNSLTSFSFFRPPAE
jgi:hypothetical protein